MFVVDDAGMSAAELGRVREALAAAGAEDRLVSAISIRGGSGRERKLARGRAAVLDLAWKPPLSAPLREAALLDTLGRVVLDLRAVEGAKRVVTIVAQPFRASEPWRRVQSIAEEALRSSAALDWLNVRPASARAVASSSAPYRWEDSVSRMLPGERALRRKVEEYAGDVGAYLAAQTGGRLMAGLAELPAALASGAGTYRIEWTPEGKADTEGRRLDVNVARAGVLVRIEGDFAEEKKREKAPRRIPPRERIQRALFSLLGGAEIPVRLTALAAPEGAADLHLKIGPEGVALPEENGCGRARLETLTAFEEFNSNAGTPIRSRVSELRICGADLDFVRRNGLALTIREKAPAGLSTVRVAVRNAPPDGGSALDSSPRLIGREESDDVANGAASQAFESPEVKERGAAVLGLTLAAAETAPGYRLAADGDAAVRRFRPGQTVIYRFHALRAGEARVRVLRDGREVAVLPAPVESDVVTGRLRLPDSIEPGAYVLEASANAASQWIDFVIVR